MKPFALLIVLAGFALMVATILVGVAMPLRVVLLVIQASCVMVATITGWERGDRG